MAAPCFSCQAWSSHCTPAANWTRCVQAGSHFLAPGCSCTASGPNSSTAAPTAGRMCCFRMHARRADHKGQKVPALLCRLCGRRCCPRRTSRRWCATCTTTRTQMAALAYTSRDNQPCLAPGSGEGVAQPHRASAQVNTVGFTRLFVCVASRWGSPLHLTGKFEDSKPLLTQWGSYFCPFW